MNPPPNYTRILEEFIKNGLVEDANRRIKEWGLNIEIQNGRVIDLSDTTDAWLNRFITRNSSMLVMKDKAKKLSKVDDEVLISGPTGTGKEIVAHAIHGERDGQFVAVNCAGLPETLIESILFGHIKGSFTDAKMDKVGLMQIAKNGTLFFDEVGELPLSMQAKFLRAIQEKKILRVGGDKEESISCRFVCATHRNLKDMVKREAFREDLYARISTMELNLIPLDKRQEDIVPIIESINGGNEFLKGYINKYGPVFKSDVSLNVRSLQQYVRRYIVLGELP